MVDREHPDRVKMGQEIRVLDRVLSRIRERLEAMTPVDWESLDSEAEFLQIQGGKIHRDFEAVTASGETRGMPALKALEEEFTAWREAVLDLDARVSGNGTSSAFS